MNYLLKPKPKKYPGVKGPLVAVALVLLCVAILFSTKSTFLASVLGTLGTPVWKANQTAVSFLAGTGGFFRDKASLVEENQALMEENEGLRIRSLERDAFAFELEEIKRFTVSEGEVARVLSSPSQSFYDGVIVELHPNSTVREGDRVFAAPSVALGVVSKRMGSLAQVTFFSSPDRETFTRLLKDGTELFLHGQGGGNFSVAVPRSLDIVSGDLVSLPYLESNIVARVAGVEEARTESFKQVFLSYPLNIFNLSWVRIVHVPES